MFRCIRNCIDQEPWYLWVGAAIVFAIIAAAAAAFTGLTIIVQGVVLGVVVSAIIAALSVFGITLSIPVLGCIGSCLLGRRL